VEQSGFILKGNILWSGEKAINSVENGYLACIGGKSAGVYDRLPPKYSALRVIDYSPCLITPGLVDLHTHAPQFAFRGLGMDLELLDWLQKHAFVEEAKYQAAEYADAAYSRFVDHLKRGFTTRLAIYATVHTGATLLLMEKLEASGLVSLVGKVNMDRNCPESLKENSDSSASATEEWIKSCTLKNTRPILTPRFIPSCSDALMRDLASLQKKYNLPVQSHLSENRKEVEWVKHLCPQSSGYAAAYRDFDLFGGGVPTVMAHCVWLDREEIELTARRQVFVAHCPQSNTNLSSGIAPVRSFLNAGITVGLGSDVAGGAHTSVFRAMSDAIQVSKLRGALLDNSEKPLTVEEVFYMGTAGGAAFFEKTGMGDAGSFEEGKEFDALVIDDGNLSDPSLPPHERLERVIYLSDERNLLAKYVKGKRIFSREQ
jgi:guanine deaminase